MDNVGYIEPCTAVDVAKFTIDAAVVERFVVIWSCGVSLEDLRDLAGHVFLCCLVSQKSQVVDDFLDLMALMWVKGAVCEFFNVNSEKIGESSFHRHFESYAF